jgi:hypothetical protein
VQAFVRSHGWLKPLGGKIAKYYSRYFRQGLPHFRISTWKLAPRCKKDNTRNLHYTASVKKNGIATHKMYTQTHGKSF